jgi:methylmalonyl-CoA mutase cobalamin-binding domain/chain
VIFGGKMTTQDLAAVQKILIDLLLEGEGAQALSVTAETLEKGAGPNEFIEMCITPSLEEIGTKFSTLEIFLPEMMDAAEIVQSIMNQIIRPAIEANKTEQMASKGKVILATVQGDLHDIGKNVVGLMLKVNGFEVIDLGVNVPPTEIIARAVAEQADIVGLSALLTTCLPYMKDVFDYMEGKGIRNKYAIIIGGAATTPETGRQFGANGQANSAAEAVELCKNIMLLKTQNYAR